MPSRSDSLRTQAQLISTAERLFAERGVEGVSLSEINRAAGQRNKSALHYHFGSREGLLKAMLEKHRRRLDAQRQALIDTAPAPEDMSLRDAVRIMVTPLADCLDDIENGGANYVRIMAQLSASPRHPLAWWLFNEMPPAFAVIAPVLYSHIPPAPTVLRMRRAQLMNGTMFHALLLQSQTCPDGEIDPNKQMYVNDLIDCLCSLICAPVSDASSEAIEAAEMDVEAMAPLLEAMADLRTKSRAALRS